AFADLRQDLRRKVQSCGGGSNAAPGLGAGIHRLVTLAVVRAVRARDIGRQGYVSQLFYRGKEIRHRFKTERPFAELASACHLGNELGGFRDCFSGSGGRVSPRIGRTEEYFFSHANLPAGTYKRLPK